MARLQYCSHKQGSQERDELNPGSDDHRHCKKKSLSCLLMRFKYEESKSAHCSKDKTRHSEQSEEEPPPPKESEYETDEF